MYINLKKLMKSLVMRHQAVPIFFMLDFAFKLDKQMNAFRKEE